MFLSKLFVLLAITVSTVLAHSWIDCVKYDPTKKLCYGYGRSYPGRTDRGSVDKLYTYRIDLRNDKSPMCSSLETAVQYTDQFPMAVVEPGETIYTTWEVNGHINENNEGALNIFYFDDPNRDFKLVGDRHTAKVAAKNLTFGRPENCFIVSDPNSVCWRSWEVPKELKAGNVYHFVWFWKFDKNPTGEWYTTCFDLKVEDKSYKVPKMDYPKVKSYGNPGLDYALGFNDQIRGILKGANSSPQSDIPSGNSSNPPGGSSNPPGDSTNPPGDSTNPPGDSTNPPGDSTNPPGDSTNPSSDPTNPSSDPTNLPGDSNNPPGDSNNPPGDFNGYPGGSNVRAKCRLRQKKFRNKNRR